MLPGALGGQVERIPDHPGDPVTGVEALLGGDLGVGALAQHAARARVRALGALPDDHHVDRLRPDPVQRSAHARVQPHRPQVHIVVEFEPQPEQEPALQDPARHRRVADRAEQQRIMAADLLEHRVRQRLAGPVPTVGTQVVAGLLEGHIRCLEHLQCLGHDLGADPVAADHGEPYLGRCHARYLTASRPRHPDQTGHAGRWRPLRCHGDPGPPGRPARRPLDGGRGQARDRCCRCPRWPGQTSPSDTCRTRRFSPDE